MNRVADNALFIDNDGEGETLGANPRHHVFSFNEVRPSEMMLICYLLNGLCIMISG